MSADPRNHLLPDNFQYYVIAEGACFTFSIVFISMMLFSLLPKVIDAMFGAEQIIISATELTYLGISALFLAGGIGLRKRKQFIAEDVGNWVELEFDDPLDVDVNIKDYSGKFTECEFIVKMKLWFENQDKHGEASRIVEQIQKALKLYLAEAGQDPVMRQSPIYLADWLNDSFVLDGLKRIEVVSSKFQPMTPKQKEEKLRRKEKEAEAKRAAKEAAAAESSVKEADGGGVDAPASEGEES